jgi:hypothetical protein
LTPPIPVNLATAAARINGELTRSSPIALSHAARARLEAVHAEFLGDVGQESIRIARRAGLATVDESHVEKAYERISSARGGGSFSTFANTLGGLLSGAALASIYAIVFSAGPHGTAEIVTALLLSIVGFALLAVGLTLSMSRRS